jgi:hypothetical protein
MYLHSHFPFLAVVLTFTMATSASTSITPSPVTRIATFRFHPNVTAAQKGDRAAAFLALYAEHPELLVDGPKGGRPLNTPLNLTNVKREGVWDTGFVVVFKVCESSWDKIARAAEVERRRYMDANDG